MFKYRFERLLKIKTQLLDKKRLEIAALVKQINETNNEIEEKKKENGLRRKKIDNLLREEKPDRNWILFLSENIEKTDEAIRNLKIKKRQLTEEKQKLIGEAQELLKEKKKLERLKEKEFENYRVENLRKEARFLDEIASIKIARTISRSQ
ncbi:hypothetical protein [Hippea jasoniae]|uniref:hypothetical protein n=1 Tax=Hippea jasoniae TaxID=944479 RepID=UPI000558BC73|nr:hypothetical protein [Hippea jasoniae]